MKVISDCVIDEPLCSLELPSCLVLKDDIIIPPINNPRNSHRRWVSTPTYTYPVPCTPKLYPSEVRQSQSIADPTAFYNHKVLKAAIQNLLAMHCTILNAFCWNNNNPYWSSSYLRLTVKEVGFRRGLPRTSSASFTFISWSWCWRSCHGKPKEQVNIPHTVLSLGLHVGTRD